MAFAEYPRQLVENICGSGVQVESFGGRVEVRSSPELPGPGRVDPRTAATRNKNWVGAKSGPADAGLFGWVEAMRERMGSANLNLNTAELYTQYEALNTGANGVGLWRYYPRRSARQGRPCLVFFHGGGFLGGTPYVVENACRLIAELAGAVVFNVDYALAPEKPYPNGPDGCYHTVRHIFEHAEDYGIDPAKIAVGGDSAGGNLAAVVCQRLLAAGGATPALLVLLYPMVAAADVGERFFHWTKDTYEIAPEDAALIEHMLRIGVPVPAGTDQTLEAYLPDPGLAETPDVSPILWDRLGEMPKTLMLLPEFDGLRQQGECYASMLARAGAAVRTIRYAGCAHAFLDLLGLVPQAEDACREIAGALKQL